MITSSEAFSEESVLKHASFNAMRTPYSCLAISLFTKSSIPTDTAIKGNVLSYRKLKLAVLLSKSTREFVQLMYSAPGSISCSKYAERTCSPMSLMHNVQHNLLNVRKCQIQLLQLWGYD